LDAEDRRSLVKWRKPPPADANPLRRWWHKKTRRWFGKNVELGIHIRLGDLERDRERLNAQMVDAFADALAIDTSGQLTPQETRETAQLLADGYLEAMESEIRNFFGDIKRDLVLAPALALTALFLLAWTDNRVLD
jgi:hypothetical protein